MGKTKIAFGVVLAALCCLAGPAAGPRPLSAETARFSDNDDGTVTDRATGLVWLAQPGALEPLPRDAAAAAAADLAAGTFDWLTDGSTAGDWRLPDYHELLTLTGDGLAGGVPPDDHPFTEFPGRPGRVFFWTASNGVYDPERTWTVRPFTGHRAASQARFEAGDEARQFWPVRGEFRQRPPAAGAPHPVPAFEGLAAREQQRAELNALWDFTGLRRRDGFTVIRSDDFLQLPEGFPADNFNDFHLASVPPTVKLQVLPNLEPEYFPEGEAYQAGWANWAKVTRSDDNRFFMAASDHRARGSKINLYEYRPGEGEHGSLRRALDVSEALGWHDDMYTDGKIHGYMGLMPDGTLWAATHRGPEPTEEWYAAGYRGAWLLSYNIHTGEAENHGVPLVGQELPSHVLDSERGIFLATGHLSTTMLCWDVNERRVRFAGSPPYGWRWQARSMFLDTETGHFWGVDSSEEPYRFLSYDPELNRFKRHEAVVPANPASGQVRVNRLHPTPRREGGWYYNVIGGTLIRFRPDWENGPEVEVVGVTGGDTVQTATCPAGRYIYWVPRRDDTMVVMQYDTATGRKKALGFLRDHVRSRYGYQCGNAVYGMNISDCGAFLVVLDDGGFGRHFGGHPALFIIEIPETERPLE